MMNQKRERRKPKQSRNWMVRFDAPEGLTEDAIASMLPRESYRVVARVMRSTQKTETHPNGYRHCHMFVQSMPSNDGKLVPIKDSTIWNAVTRMLRDVDPEKYPEGKQPSIYCRKPRGGIRACIDYVMKDEKECGDDVSEVAISPIIGEQNPSEFAGYDGSGSKADMLRSAVLEDGRSRCDLMHDASLSNIVSQKLPYLDRLLAQRAEDEFASSTRDVQSLYLYGPSNVGKSTAVRDLFELRGLDVFVVSDWIRDPWGGYDGEEVVLFDDFRLSEIVKVASFSDLLRWMDRFPVQLPRRYQNAWAGWGFVVFTSNWSPERQLDGTFLQPEDRVAFYRRLSRIIRVDDTGELHDETAAYQGDVQGRGHVDLDALASLLDSPVPPLMMPNELPSNVTGMQALDLLGARYIGTMKAEVA